MPEVTDRAFSVPVHDTDPGGRSATTRHSGDIVSGAGATLRAVTTPGKTLYTITRQNSPRPDEERGDPPVPSNRPPANPNPSSGKSVRRESVAAVRKTSNNRTQLIIGAVAVVLIIAVVVFGLVQNKANDVRRNDGYGIATRTTATISEGVITVAAGTTGKVIDIFEDPMCPACGDFEYQFGQELAQPLNEGKVIARYHFMIFLNSVSPSQDYSTRANAAMMCVVQNSGSTPGVFAAFHDALFSRDFQPEEKGDSDPSNNDLAAKATAVGASTAAADCITAGTNIELAKTTGQASSDALAAAKGEGTPTVLRDGVKILTNDNWIPDLLAAG